MAQQVLDPGLQRHGRGRAARAGALHVDIDHAAVETVKGDVSAILRHGRAHAAVEQLLDLGHDLGIRPVAVISMAVILGLACIHHRLAGLVMLHDRAKDRRFQMRPFLRIFLRNRDEIRAEKDARDAFDREYPARQRRIGGRIRIREIGRPRRHHRLTGKEFECRRIRGCFGLNEHRIFLHASPIDEPQRVKNQESFQNLAGWHAPPWRCNSGGDRHLTGTSHQPGSMRLEEISGDVVARRAGNTRNLQKRGLVMLRHIIVPFLIASFASAAFAADAVPARRLLPAIDQDFYGADIRSIRETDLATCRAACLADPSCQAMTYNQRSHACFLKSGVERVEHFEGAVSARIVERTAEERDRAVARAADLSFLPDELLSDARELAGKLGLWLAARTDAAPEEIRAKARASEQAGNLAGAAREFASAVLVTDSADDWQDLARIWLEMADQPRAREMEDQLSAAGLRADPAAAAINAYLRAANADEEAAALTLLARTLEARGEGPAMIPALRLAQDLSPDRGTADLLDYALSNYGFRIIDHKVDSEPASPRICVQFSEALAEGVDYAPYLRIADHADLPVETDGQQLCIEGVEHGESYRLLVREGLPSASDEKLRRTAEITAYVRDRSPAARFIGRAYVLPESTRSTIPVVTVNTDRVELAIFRMGERSLADAIGEGLFGRAIGEWTESRLKERLGEQLWKGEAEVERRLNTDITTALPIGEAIKKFEPGVYVMTARVPGSGEPWEDAATQWFIVSDLGLSTTSGTDGVHVFARSLSDASAVEGAMARLIAKNNTVLGEAETDESGAAHFDARLASGTGGNAPALAVVEHDGDFAFLDLTEAPFDLSDRGVEGRAAPGPVDVFLTTERGVYRPGETVHATALARDSLADAISGLPLTAVITRPDGVEYARAVLDRKSVV